MDIEVFRFDWLMLALTIGIVLLVLTVLTYIPIWKSNKAEEDQTNVEIKDIRSFIVWLQATFPWVLILTLLGTFVLMIIFPLYMKLHPPNW
ncbi:MAG: hypothetical protein ABFD50_16120 [Smithella sp.]